MKYNIQLSVLLIFDIIVFVVYILMTTHVLFLSYLLFRKRISLQRRRATNQMSRLYLLFLVLSLEYYHQENIYTLFWSVECICIDSNQWRDESSTSSFPFYLALAFFLFSETSGFSSDLTATSSVNILIISVLPKNAAVDVNNTRGDRIVAVCTNRNIFSLSFFLAFLSVLSADRPYTMKEKFDAPLCVPLCICVCVYRGKRYRLYSYFLRFRLTLIQCSS